MPIEPFNSKWFTYLYTHWSIHRINLKYVGIKEIGCQHISFIGVTMWKKTRNVFFSFLLDHRVRNSETIHRIINSWEVFFNNCYFELTDNDECEMNRFFGFDICNVEKDQFHLSTLLVR